MENRYSFNFQTTSFLILMTKISLEISTQRYIKNVFEFFMQKVVKNIGFKTNIKNEKLTVFFLRWPYAQKSIWRQCGGLRSKNKLSLERRTKYLPFTHFYQFLVFKNDSHFVFFQKDCI